MQACQRDLIKFSKFANDIIRKEKRHICIIQWKRKTEQSWTFVLSVKHTTLLNEFNQLSDPVI